VVQFRKRTLINNLKKIVENISNLDLPAKIVSIYAFGSILREKKEPHDIDLVILYTMTSEQVERWERFTKNFSTYGMDEKRYPIQELEKYLMPYNRRAIPLGEAVKDEELANILRQRGVEPVWAGCFSWTDVLYNPYGNFIPSIETVMRRMLFRRKIKGFQTKFSGYQFYVNGHIPFLSAKNYQLAWSIEKPDVERNLLRRSIHEKMVHIAKELDHFINDEIPRLKKAFLDAKESVVKAGLNTNFKLDVEALARQHTEIQRTENESYKELAEKCEKGRAEMNKYREETDVLKEIANILESWERIMNWVHTERYSAEEYVSQRVIENSAKMNVSETRVREILHTLGLPEDHIITIRKYGRGTYYEVARTVEEKSRLLNEIKKEKKRAKLLKAIVRTIRSIDPRARAYLEFTENGQPKWLQVYVDMMTDQLDNAEKIVFEEQLKKKGFKIEKTSWYMRGSKRIDLKRTENSTELQEIARKIMTD